MLLKNIIDYLKKFLYKVEYCQTKEFVIQVGPQFSLDEKIVKKVLITQNLTLKCIAYAKKNKFNLIICKNGLPLESIKQIDETLQRYIYILQQGHITVGILPSSWYYVDEGPIEHIAKILSLYFDEMFLDPESRCIGKIFSSKRKLNFESIISTLHRSLNIEIIDAYSNGDTFHDQFCVVHDKLTPNNVRNAKFHNCDCIISPEISFNSLTYLKFYEISYIQIPIHHVMEATLNRLCSILATEFPRNEIEFFPSETILQTYCRKQNH